MHSATLENQLFTYLYEQDEINIRTIEVSLIIVLISK